MEEKGFVYEGKQVKYYIQGSGDKKIVLLHGYSFNSFVWEQVGLFKTLEGLGYRAFALDVPGFPRSANRFKIEEADFSNLLDRFLEEVVKGKAVLLGSSASAYLALKFAEEHANKLLALIVVGPVGLDRVNTKAIRVKTLGIWGVGDIVSNPSENSKILRLSKEAEIRTIENAGHACYLDRSEEFNRLISEFLSSL